MQVDTGGARKTMPGTRTIRVVLALGVAVIVALTAGGTSASAHGARTTIWSNYACTLQGTTGLTYIVETQRYSDIRPLCRALKVVLKQRQLRWGLHPPSFSSDEPWQATWINRHAKAKITMLARNVPAVRALKRAVNHILTSGGSWRRVGQSYYP